ncbi:MAG: hypothetical protein E6K05_02840 [Methanobacteriota archaeon]|nr:MAG: hypothetical protein E6K05_02840 [Euryarchaeota archaeon]
MCRHLKVCPAFRDAATNAVFRNVRPIRTMRSAGAEMKAFISIDMEGICGVVREIEADPVRERARRGRGSFETFCGKRCIVPSS